MFERIPVKLLKIGNGLLSDGDTTIEFDVGLGAENPKLSVLNSSDYFEISSDLKINGNLDIIGDLAFDGSITGNIAFSGAVTVGGQSVLTGSINNSKVASDAAIAGSKITAATSSAYGTVKGGQMPVSPPGAAITSGFAGYSKSVAIAVYVGSTTALTWVNSAQTLTLEEGEWEVHAMQPIWIYGGSGTSGNFRAGLSRIQDASNSEVLQTCYAGSTESTKFTDVSQAYHNLTILVPAGQTKVLRLGVTSSENSGATTISGLQGSYGSSGYIKAVKK
jgi:hypothetical protein